MRVLVLVGAMIGVMIGLGVGLLAEEMPLPAEILARIDKNMVYNTVRTETDMVITTGNRTRTKTFVSYAEGNKKSYMEFLSPARDKGVKMLKLEDVIKVYYPSAERVQRLSGHMLKQRMMGSDFSYEDMTERSRKLLEEYDGVVEGEETVEARSCYVLVLTSKVAKQTYYKRKAWVDKERWVVLKEELYAKSGKLLKEGMAHDMKTFKDRHYPTRYTMVDKLLKNSKTEIRLKSIEFDINIPEDIFSERQLQKR